MKAEHAAGRAVARRAAPVRIRGGRGDPAAGRGGSARPRSPGGAGRREPGVVVRDWNAQGITTTTGKPWRSRELGRVLKRPRNAGLLEHLGQVAGPAKWPAVVDETTWRGVSRSPVRTRRGRSRPARRTGTAVVDRPVRACGGPVICTSTNRPSARVSGRRLVYRCSEEAAGTWPGTRAAGRARDRAGDRPAVPAGTRRTCWPRPATAASWPRCGGEGGHRGADRRAEQAACRPGDHDAELVEGRRQLRAGWMRSSSGSPVAGAGGSASRRLIADPAGVWERMVWIGGARLSPGLMTVTLSPRPKGRPTGMAAR